ncbi:MAG: glycosyltransferase family 2 protein [Candidatus Komeilibacteria bacterium]|nr:glycosyltransferase family 2 protein [Candidatus Komeilibacteria bacterium]
MDLSIIILNYRQKGLVKYCLKNLLSLDLPMSCEIIVVDNASGDGLAEMLAAEFMGVKFVAAPLNRGYGAGNNLGIKKSSGKYVLILNPDVRLNAEAISGLYEFLEARAQAGLVGPKILNPDGSLQYTCSRFPDWHLPFYRRTFLGKSAAGQKWNEHYLMMDWDHLTEKSVDWLFGACLMARREAIDQVGLFDEQYFLYMEDLDWCRRFWENSREVWYLPQAEVIHYHQRASAEVNVFWSLFSRTPRSHLLSWLKYYFKFKNKKLPR